MTLNHLPVRIQLEGSRNFRDMGGYPVANGRRIQHGKLFRSDQLNSITDNDVEKLTTLGIKTVVDFRRSSEREKAPDHPINGDVNHISLPIGEQGTNVFDVWDTIESGILTEEKARTYLIKANKGFVVAQSEIYAEFTSVLMNPDNYPLVFHCAAGKDRAGFAAASVLMNLGASRDVILHDYLATNLITERLIKDLIAQRPKLVNGLEGLTALMQVQPEYIGKAFTTIDRVYGSVDRYLSEAQNMDGMRRAQLVDILCD